MKMNICTLSGDGIGPEIVNSAKAVLCAVAGKFGHEINFSERLIGGIAIDQTGHPLPQNTLDTALKSDAVLLGAVGGDKWDNCPIRPESALLKIRQEMGVYANIRPAKIYDSLCQNSPLKNEILAGGLDFVIVRELTGGIYFGERGLRQNDKFGREAFDTESYSELEIERVARCAYELAEKRDRKLCLVDKANVMTSSKLWRQVVSQINEDYPSVALSTMYVDNAGMQIVLNPGQFDVILTSNMFGDILSDLSASCVGSIGVMPSASLGASTLGLYEAIHGSAPSIAGKNIANPVGTILSSALMLRHSFDLESEARAIENAVQNVLRNGIKTCDIGGQTSTSDMTQAIISEL